MTLTVSHTSVNCRNAYELSQWWGQMLGYAGADDNPNQPGDEECLLISPDHRHHLLFLEVEELQEPGRMHFDLASPDGTRDEEVARALALGATQVADRRTDQGRGWVVMADPEGNVFCIVRGDAERRVAGDWVPPRS